jgi:single-stranded-DNA-specific exonuclease
VSRKIKRRKIAVNGFYSAAHHSVLSRIYAARNISSDTDLDYSLQGLPDYQSLSGIDAATDLLQEALENRRRILIVADFDADGATSCALAIRGLKQMGAVDIHYMVPSRFDFGYGLSPELVEVAAGLEPDLLITVDNGISSLEGVQLAREKAIRILITDHHLPGPQLPAADAIVNPNLPGDEFPGKHLAGVGVMFYVLAALRARLHTTGWFRQQHISAPNLAALLDLVALGTIADVVPLDRCNRIMIAQGLARIRAGHCLPGIKSLLKTARRNYAGISAGDLGFAVAPRLNAAGRLADMSLGIECLLCDDADQALAMAAKLDALNSERREIQQEMQDTADAEMSGLQVDDLPLGLCLFNTAWHQGVVGILASRIKDKWYRPVIAFARDSDGLIKGSGRSIKSVHIRDLLESIAVNEPGLIKKFGGHAMAAGLTIREHDFPLFRMAFENELSKQLTPDDLEDCVITDGELEEHEMELSLAEAIRNGGPWGQGFPEPLFDGLFELAGRRIVGDHHLKLTVKLPGQKRTYDAIAFYTADDDWPENVARVLLAYRLDINEYRGRKMLQLVVEHLEPVSQ